MPTISYEDQTKITRAIIKAAVMMLEYGAESKLIEQTSQRMGAALGMDSVEMSLIPSAIVLSTLTPNQSVTTTLMAHHKPINMSIVYDVQRICIDLEKEHHAIETVTERLEKINPNYYNRWLVIFMVGFSCASFAYLAGADIVAFFITFLASSVAMAVRQELAKHKFISLIIFAITAFVATVVASLSYFEGISSTPSIAISSSVLLLVPGFPFINSFLDAVKGFLSMGWGRWLQATLLTLATSMGIIFAMSLLNIKGW